MRTKFGTISMAVSIVALGLLVIHALQDWTRSAFTDTGKDQFGGEITYLSSYYDTPSVSLEFSNLLVGGLTIAAVATGVLALILLAGKKQVLGLGFTWLVIGLTLQGHFTDPASWAWIYLFGGSIVAVAWPLVISIVGDRLGIYKKQPVPVDAAALKRERVYDPLD